MSRHRKKRPKIDDIAKYFNKKYGFKSGSEWHLPVDVYKSNKWILESLQIKKTELNDVKELLGKYDLVQWSRHTKSRDPSTAVLNKLRWEYSLEFQTQAWCKFYEIVNNFPLISPTSEKDKRLNSLHLCEAPGAFVCSLNHFLAYKYPRIEWNWTANALNPYYEGNSENEMITDDRFLKMTFDNWNFGKDFTGNITSYDNHLEIVDCVKDVLLVTADGSVDCMWDPGNQENHVSHLHYCETITALRVLNKGGSFVLKIFTMFEDSTVCLLYLLNCLFNEVHVFKPLTSKSGNSELYVVCLEYKGREQITNWNDYLIPYKMGFANNHSMFDLECLPEDFLNQIHECSEYFMQLQMRKIKDNIKAFGKNSAHHFLKKFNHSIADYFVKTYSMSNIPVEKRITKGTTVADNTKKTNRFYTIFEKDQISVELDLRCGKKYQQVLYSKFCTNDNVKNFNFKRNNTKFYNLILASLACNYNIINMTHSDPVDLSKFHYTFLCELKNCIESRKDLIIIGPIVTNILANLIYLLTNSFEHCIFLNVGCVIFKQLINHSNLLKQIDLISEEYAKCFAKNNCDLLQIIKHNRVINSNLLNVIIEYNNNFAKYWHLAM